MPSPRLKVISVIFAAIFLAALASIPLYAAPGAQQLQGRWVADVKGDGRTFSFIFNFKTTGGTLTGTVELSTRDDEFPIKNGKIEGNNVSFMAFGDWTGTLEGNELKLTRGLDYGKKQQMIAHRSNGDQK